MKLVKEKRCKRNVLWCVIFIIGTILVIIAESYYGTKVEKPIKGNPIIIDSVADHIGEEYLSICYASDNINNAAEYILHKERLVLKHEKTFSQRLTVSSMQNIQMVKEYIDAQAYTEVPSSFMKEIPLSYPLILFTWATEHNKNYSQALYSNGYLIIEDGPIYEIHLEWEPIEAAILESHSSPESPLHYEYSPSCRMAGRKLLFFSASKNGEWNSEYLCEVAAEDYVVLDSEFRAEITEVTEKDITVQITNLSETRWFECQYDSPASLEVFLAGKWYFVPRFCQTPYIKSYNSAGNKFPSISPGDTQSRTDFLKDWEGCKEYLPTGHYRISYYGCTYEFDI